MNAAIDLHSLQLQDQFALPGLEQVFYHPTFVKVINELKAPKSHTNDFGGGYKYRSAEDIQEALKPVLLKHKCSVIMRKFDMADGFEIHAYIVFKDQKYIRCEVPGVARYDFERDLASNKKVSRTQQYASYQSYAKKYALSNLLMIDDSQNDLDTFTNSQIQSEQKSSQKYQDKNVAHQKNCDLALKQITDLPLGTPIHQAEFFFDGLRAQYPEFEHVLYEACKVKHAQITQHFESLNKQVSEATVEEKPADMVLQHHEETSHAHEHNPISQQECHELQVFIHKHGLDDQSVCEHFNIPSLSKIEKDQLRAIKAEIQNMLEIQT